MIESVAVVCPSYAPSPSHALSSRDSQRPFYSERPQYERTRLSLCSLVERGKARHKHAKPRTVAPYTPQSELSQRAVMCQLDSRR
eukprot:scaffold145170_cov127-Phaeocystis_antarctica.AAC.7